MKKSILLSALVMVSILLTNKISAQLSTAASSDANELMDTFLAESPNLSYTNATLIGAEGSIGTYSSAEFGNGSGVILSTGQISDAAGPNTSIAETTNNNSEGDSHLDDLLDITTNDAASLSADIVPEGNELSFSYVFASEDYNAYVCSPFSDAIGVIISGGEYDSENIALVPSTELFVGSNTVNSGDISDNIWQPGGCPEGGLSNADFFIDNADGDNLEFNGRSILLTGTVAVTPGETYTIKWVIADANDALFDSALFLESGSLTSSEPECDVAGGELTVEGPDVVCKSDGIDDPFSLSVEGAVGENQVFVATFLNGNIIFISENSNFNLEGVPGNGTCLFWSLSWNGEITGAEVGLNANNIEGDCFALSNPVPVTEYFTNGGTISTTDSTTICVGDGEADFIDVALSGDIGQNSAWVITDESLNILGLPAAPPFNLEGTGEGICLIWHLSWSGELEGAMVGANAADLSGDCFDLSNPIEVVREICEEPCIVDGGTITTDGPTMICKSDGEDDIFALDLEGAVGENQLFVVTWLDGEIILTSTQSSVNLEGVPGNGVCLFWSLSWNGEISGLEPGLNAFDITGDCFDFSNSIEVTEYFTNGGDITSQDPSVVCAGEDGVFNVELTGEAGQSGAWVITDEDLNILDLPAGPPFSYGGFEPGTILIWHLSWSGDIFGAAVGENAAELSGDCFDLSNSIELTVEECCAVDGGTISTDVPTLICKSDGEDDIFSLNLEGNVGENQTFVVTWLDGEIILTSNQSSVNLEGIPGNGVCLFWSLSWNGEISGLEPGLNALDVTGDCFDFSNSVEVTEYYSLGGDIFTSDDTSVCVGDGSPDLINVELVAEAGQNSAFVITDADLNIVNLPAGPTVDFESFSPGAYLVWHLSWSGELEGATVGANAADLSGDCFDLSNPIDVTAEDCSSAGASTEVEWTHELMTSPNPNDGTAIVTYSSNKNARTLISVFNVNGQQVLQLFNEQAVANVKYTFQLDGAHLPNGVYFYQITDGTEVRQEKFMIAR
jgi:hypothetical protein